jgi:hypothetical protein
LRSWRHPTEERGGEVLAEPLQVVPHCELLLLISPAAKSLPSVFSFSLTMRSAAMVAGTGGHFLGGQEVAPVKAGCGRDLHALR